MTLRIFFILLISFKIFAADCKKPDMPTDLEWSKWIENIKLEALKKSLSLTDNHIDREHVTRYIYKNPSKFSITNIDCFTNKDLIKLRLVVDDEIDLNRSRWITKKLNERKCEFNTMEIIDLAKEWEKKIKRSDKTRNYKKTDGSKNREQRN